MYKSVMTNLSQNLLNISCVHLSEEEIFDALSTYFNDLIQNDFNKLIALLYQMDVSEEKIRFKLAHPMTNESAGAMLANEFISREMEKMKWRERYKNGEL